MPLERKSKPFKDISLSFGINPLNSDLIDLKNIDAINRSIQNLILTNNGERFFNYELGSGITGLLFEPSNRITAKSIEDNIRSIILRYEPRVSIIDLTVTQNEEDYAYDVTFEYEIIGIMADNQQLTFVLQQ